MDSSKNFFYLYSGLGGPLGFAYKEQLEGIDNSLGFRSSDCDLLDKNMTHDFFLKVQQNFPEKFITYVHLAAVSGGSHLSEKVPATLFVDNIQMAINSLNACQINGISRVILVLSTACYSPDINDPNESNLHMLPIKSSEYGYAYAKRMFEVLMRAYNKQYGMKISCVLVNGIIGANMNFNPEKSILPAALIKKFVDNKLNDSIIELWGDGTPIREYTSSKDLARAIKWCVLNQQSDTLLNIGNTSKISVQELAYLIADIIGIDRRRIKFTGQVSYGKQIQATNNAKFRALSNFLYSNITEAIKEAIESYTSTATVE